MRLNALRNEMLAYRPAQGGHAYHEVAVRYLTGLEKRFGTARVLRRMGRIQPLVQRLVLSALRTEFVRQQGPA